jgi:hypothetical protein
MCPRCRSFAIYQTFYYDINFTPQYYWYCAVCHWQSDEGTGGTCRPYWP